MPCRMPGCSGKFARPTLWQSSEPLHTCEQTLSMPWTAQGLNTHSGCGAGILKAWPGQCSHSKVHHCLMVAVCNFAQHQMHTRVECAQLWLQMGSTTKSTSSCDIHERLLFSLSCLKVLGVHSCLRCCIATNSWPCAELQAHAR